jgi:hypothetical protein
MSRTMRLPKIAILVASLAFAGWVFYALRAAEPVRVSETSLQHEAGGVFVQGKIQNNGPDTGPVDIEVRYYDGSGHRVGQDKIVMDKLPKGIVASFRTPPRAIDRAASFSLYLNHGRNPYGN